MFGRGYRICDTLTVFTLRILHRKKKRSSTMRTQVTHILSLPMRKMLSEEERRFLLGCLRLQG